MGRACRDCPRCTEVAILSLVMVPFRIVHFMLTSWNIQLVQRKCPDCGHRLSIHKKVGGRFVD